MAASCAPPQGQTLLTIGQDFFSIQEYVSQQYNASLHRASTDNTLPMTSFSPAATMFYTDIQELKGIDVPVDYGSGVEFAQGLAEAWPQSGIQIGLWLNGTTGCKDIVSGNLDHQVEHMFELLEALPTQKVFLRVGYEFDNPSFGYSDDPAVYAKAFRQLVSTCEEQMGHWECHEKVAFCWHSWGAPRYHSLEDFYPGEDVVDWVGVSLFQQMWKAPATNTTGGASDYVSTSTSSNDSLEDVDWVRPVLEFATAHKHPIMIAESTPFGGIGNDAAWEDWFVPVLDLIDTYDIQMWSYINCDWDIQPMWHNIGFGDTRLSVSSHVMDGWYKNVLQNPRFVTGPLECPKLVERLEPNNNHEAMFANDMDLDKNSMETVSWLGAWIWAGIGLLAFGVVLSVMPPSSTLTGHPNQVTNVVTFHQAQHHHDDDETLSHVGSHYGSIGGTVQYHEH